MKPWIRWTLLVIVALVGIVLIALPILRSQTKKHSPEDTVEYTHDGLELSVFYNRPYKKGRVIFGRLVPFNEVWRTGANEATTFTTNKNLALGGKTLAAGTYTLWTIPNEKQWAVIFNSKMYDWGVSVKGTEFKASREPEYDMIYLEVPVEPLDKSVEQFTITLGEPGTPVLSLMWDTTIVRLPLTP